MNDDQLVPRPVRDSQSEMAELVLPNDANPLGALLGGRLMHWIDLAGAMAAHRHSRNYVVTASIDHMDFLVPVHIGDLVILRSSVNRVFRSLDGSWGKSLGRKLHPGRLPPCEFGVSDLRSRGRSWASFAGRSGHS